ncbi:MAG: hypothetical protein II992_06495 [Lachnospiraceae bacterium]|nr:hypothetical protein [Lachnospiraceae bacterium]
MTQQILDSCSEKEQLRHELYDLLHEGLNKEGDSNYNLVMQDAIVYCDSMCERTGLYY